LYAATCRHCGREIVQHPSGVWIPRDGSLKSDPKGFYCRAGGRPTQMVHEPMPAELPGAPRWLSPDTPESQGASPDDDRDRRRGRIRAPHLRETVRAHVRCALVRLRNLTQFHMAWW
jgi:hypothetical protein